ncbi:ABC transporter ATP-binding protein [Chachezhania sediminis]|uniref:ABC transporter ATP-binding protein n=1 Tax=Chachezhania sediminis TaxID=2599291 RepID=UPI001E4C1F0D|nr:ABC transporter ATP-binding protein [Chachezhania sediminis]
MSAPESMPVLQVRDLTIDYPGRGGLTRAVDGVSFALGAGRVLGVVGESGSGKSSIGMAAMGLTEASHAVIGGEMKFAGTDLAKLKGQGWRSLRGERVSMVFQDAMATLNPVLRVGDQIADMFRYHRPQMSRKARRAAVLDLLEQVGIRDADKRIDNYPHELSGGMRQRIVIAAAIALEPELLIADEPTTALDVTVQAQILDLMQDLIREREMAMLFISHDLDVVGDICDDVVVMRHGKIVEAGRVDDVLIRPRHPYTQELLAARPQFRTAEVAAVQSGGSHA